MRSFNSQRLRLFGEKFELCLDRTGKREGGGGFVRLGEGTLWASRSALCVPEGAKKKQSKDHKTIESFGSGQGPVRGL